MSESLVEYIESLLAKGYSEAQIRTYLEQQNYPQSLIDTAFTAITDETKERAPKRKKTSASDDLANYIRTYMAQGYSETELKNTLLADGYTDKQIDNALAKATGTQRVEHHLPAATVIKILFLLIVVAGIAYGFLLLKGDMIEQPGNTHLLDVALSLDETVFEPGEKLLATASVTNMGSGRYDVILSYQLHDNDGTRLWSERVTKAVSTSFEDSQTVPTEELPEGRYELSLTATYGGEAPAEAARSFTISATPEEVPEVEEPIIKQPEREIIVATTENADQEAYQAAKNGNSERAEGLCLGIRNFAAKDNCLNKITLEDRQASHCGAMSSTEMRDNCYLSFALEGQYELCDELSAENKALCKDMERIESMDTITLNTSSYLKKA